MRSDEQITADLEARYQELLAEKERRYGDPELQYPCQTCRWLSHLGDDGWEWQDDFVGQYGTCTNALVKGFDKYGPRVSKLPMPCGPEKALWQPKLTLCQRIMEWFA